MRPSQTARGLTIVMGAPDQTTYCAHFAELQSSHAPNAVPSTDRQTLCH